MLSKRQRLRVAEFAHFFARGKRSHGTYCTLVYTPHAQFRGAVVVGKKVCRKAVDRNRLRRQLYPALQQFATQQQATGVFQCLVKPAAAGVPVATVRAELNTLLAGVVNTS